MDSAPLRVDRADVRQDRDEHTLILSAGGVHVLMIRLRYAGWVDEVISSTGTVASWAVNAWALVDHDLSLELAGPAVAALGLPRQLGLRLDVDDEAIRVVRAALLEILQCACFLVDTPEGRLRG